VAGYEVAHLQNMLVQPDKKGDLVSTAPGRRLLKTCQVEDISDECIILSTELVHQQVLHVTHDTIDGAVLATTPVAQASCKVLQQRPILLLNLRVLIEVVQALHKAGDIILIDGSVELELQCFDGGVGFSKLRTRCDRWSERE
jgi:hypothetical protein